MDFTPSKQRECTILFARCPRPGAVKTRLSVDFLDKSVAELYLCFIKDITETLEDTGIPYRVYVHNSDGTASCDELDFLPSSLYRQKGEDLGERMKNAFVDTFRNEYKSVIILGSDIPDLPAEIIREGFQALRVKDCVIGPAHDGGYYLLGFNVDTFRPEVFAEMEWSTDMVYEQTLDILQSKPYDVHILPVQRDIDALDDLKDYLARHGHGESFHSGSHTLGFLSQNRMILQV